MKKKSLEMEEKNRLHINTDIAVNVNGGEVVVGFTVTEKIEKTVEKVAYRFLMFSFCYFVKLQA